MEQNIHSTHPDKSATVSTCVKTTLMISLRQEVSLNTPCGTNLTEFTPVLPDARFNGQYATCYCNLRNLKITIEKRLSFFILSRFKNCLYALYKAI